MRLCAVVVLVAVLLGCPSASVNLLTPSAARPPTAEPQALESSSLESLGAEFRRLRLVKGHAAGGEWNEEVDPFGCRKHRVMQVLLARLGTRGTERSRLVGALGPPDEVAHPGTELWRYTPREGSPTDEEASERLIYSWRGRHDFLVFSMRDDHVLSAGWWMAWE